MTEWGEGDDWQSPEGKQYIEEDIYNCTYFDYFTANQAIYLIWRKSYWGERTVERTVNLETEDNDWFCIYILLNI